MRELIKAAALRGWAYVYAATARGAWRSLDTIEAIAGLEGVLRALEDSYGDGAAQILRARGAHVGARVRISRGLTLHNAESGFGNLTIGDGCHLGRQVFLDMAAPITLAARVTVSMRSMIVTHTALGDSNSIVGKGIERCEAVAIDEDAYLGAGVIVLPGVTIGRGAVVGAGAVVTRSLPPSSVAVGIPARLRDARTPSNRS